GTGGSGRGGGAGAQTPRGGAGGKRGTPALGAARGGGAISPPTATAVINSLPLAPPASSAAASAAGRTLAMACTTAPSCRQSYSWLCICQAFRKTAVGAASRAPPPQTGTAKSPLQPPTTSSHS